MTIAESTLMISFNKIHVYLNYLAIINWLFLLLIFRMYLKYFNKKKNKILNDEEDTIWYRILIGWLIDWYVLSKIFSVPIIAIALIVEGIRLNNFQWSFEREYSNLLDIFYVLLIFLVLIAILIFFSKIVQKRYLSPGSIYSNFILIPEKIDHDQKNIWKSFYYYLKLGIPPIFLFEDQKEKQNKFQLKARNIVFSEV